MRFSPLVRFRPRTVVLIVLVLLAASFVLVPRLSSRAVAQGKVERWIHSMEWWDRDGTEAENQQRQAAGLREMGEAALEPLVAELNFDPAYLRFLKRIPFLDSFLSPPNQFDDPAGRRRSGAHFLGVLGPLAAPAVGSLLERANDSDSMVRLEVAMALGKIGRDEPAVRTALTNLLSVSDRYIPFAAALALWKLDPRSLEAKRRVESLMPAKDPAAAGEFLVDQGPQAAVFAPTLARHIEMLPLSAARLRGNKALWKLTGDRKYVLRDLEVLGPALEDAIAKNRGSGWSAPEDALMTAGHVLDEESEFRDRLIPLLRMVRANPAARAQDAAFVYLKRLEILNRRASTNAPPPLR